MVQMHNAQASQGCYNILRRTIERYLGSAPSLTFNTIKTKIIMHAFHSSRYLQSKWMLDFSHVQPSILKSHKRSKMIKNHFYRLYSIMNGSKIIAGSPSKEWLLILQLLSVFYCKFVVKLARVCHNCAFLLKKLCHYLGQWLINGSKKSSVVSIRT